MAFERIDGALIVRAGSGEWYNQAGRGVWDMGEDAANLPAARWHIEVEAAIRAQDSRPPLLVIDATEMTYLVAQDIGFLIGLSERLKPVGITLTVMVGSNERRAWQLMSVALQNCFNMVGSLGEALGRS